MIITIVLLIRQASLHHLMLMSVSTVTHHKVQYYCIGVHTSAMYSGVPSLRPLSHSDHFHMNSMSLRLQQQNVCKYTWQSQQCYEMHKQCSPTYSVTSCSNVKLKKVVGYTSYHRERKTKIHNQRNMYV